MRESRQYQRLAAERRTAIAEGCLAPSGKRRRRSAYQPSPNPRILTFASNEERATAWTALQEAYGLRLGHRPKTTAGAEAYERDKAWIARLLARQAAERGEGSLGSALLRHTLQRRAEEVIERHLYGKGAGRADTRARVR